MTLEEAIQHCQEKATGNCACAEDHRQLAEWLNELKKRREITGDTISRQAVIDLIKDVCDAIMSGCKSHYDPEVGDEVYDDIREVDAILKCNKEIRIAIRKMSSAERHGKWLHEQGFAGNYFDCFVCNQCKKESMAKTNYCPHCGAKMNNK